MASPTTRQTAPFRKQVVWAAALAVLVIVMHSGHLLADDAQHAWPPDQMAAHALATPSSESGAQLLDHAEAEGCMILELCAPRVVVLTSIGIAAYALVLLVVVPGVAHVSAAEWTARAPPGPRRQAFLGAFLS